MAKQQQADEEPIADEPASLLPVAPVLGVALAASLLSLLAFPPIGWAPLIVLGAAGYVWLARWPGTFRALHYWAVWLAGTLFWLALLEGVRRAHWSAHFGWLALAAYLAVYLVLFVALARAAYHTLKTPLSLAAPIIWVGLEYARGLGPVGFSAGLAGHAWCGWPEMIQAADLAGGYTISAAILLVAAALVETYDFVERRWNVWPGVAAAIAITLLVGYGYSRLQPDEPSPAPLLRVALIQGSIDTAFDADPSREYRTFVQYFTGTVKALKQQPDCQLVVWPETTMLLETGRYTDRDGELRYRRGFPFFTVAADFSPPNATPEEAVEERAKMTARIEELHAWLRARVTEMVSVTGMRAGQGPQFLVGAPVVDYTTGAILRRNSALLFDASGTQLARYDKVHPVLFGEYVPFGDIFPWLYSLTPFSGGLTPGDGPHNFLVGDHRCSPSICFESTVPQLVRGQVATLTERNESPDVLINVTNDGWFWGSAVLDLHLACNIFRAVENRRPVLVAANTGLTAQIDDRGRILQIAPRRTEAFLLCNVAPSQLSSPYVVIGDWPALLCLIACIATIVAAWWKARHPPEA